MFSFSVRFASRYSVNKFGENKMRSFLIGGLLALTTCTAIAQSEEIATCRNPSGRAFYHFNGLNNKTGSGWSDDKISNGVITLVRAADGNFDMLYVDMRSKPISMTQDGAKIRLLRLSQDNVTVLAYYDNSTTEIYSFFKEKDGKNRYSVLTNKTGNDVVIPKSSVMVGDCSAIRFDLIK